jgi:hypothetical protein
MIMNYLDVIARIYESHEVMVQFNDLDLLKSIIDLYKTDNFIVIHTPRRECIYEFLIPYK